MSQKLTLLILALLFGNFAHAEDICEVMDCRDIPGIVLDESKNTSLQSYRKHSVEILGSHLAFIDEGQGPPVLFIHGDSSSSALWRKVIPYVVNMGHRVVAPDLIGMGDSGGVGKTHHYEEHAQFIDEFVQKLNLEGVVLVTVAWGNSLGMEYVRKNEGNVDGLVAIGEPFTKQLIEKPIHGLPKSVESVANENARWLKNTSVPMLYFYALPHSPAMLETLVSEATNLETRYLAGKVQYLSEDGSVALGSGIADWLHRNVPTN